MEEKRQKLKKILIRFTVVICLIFIIQFMNGFIIPINSREVNSLDDFFHYQNPIWGVSDMVDYTDHSTVLKQKYKFRYSAGYILISLTDDEYESELSNYINWFSDFENSVDTDSQILDEKILNEKNLDVKFVYKLLGDRKLSDYETYLTFEYEDEYRKYCNIVACNPQDNTIIHIGVEQMKIRWF